MLFHFKHIYRYCATLLLLLLFLVASAKSSVFKGLSVSDGLSDLVVNALYKDSMGYMWIGTGNTLERFDGVRLKHYPVDGANEKLKRINAIVQSAGGEIWMGNGMGLWRINKNTDTLEQISSETLNSSVNTLLANQQGALYIGTDTGLFIYHNGKFTHILLDSNILSAANIINGLAFDGDGLLWLATNDGLFSFNLSNHQINSYSYSIDRKSCILKNITCICDNLYLGTMGQGIVRFNLATHQFTSYLSVDCNVISALSSDGKDTLYVGTDGNGVHFISTKQQRIVQSFRHSPNQAGSIRSNSVYSLLIDRDGLIWVGFYQLGLDYTLYQRDIFKTYQYPPHFDSHNMPVRTIAKKGSELLVGSRDGLFFIDEKNRRFKSFKIPELRSNMIMSSCEFQGKYYVGTYGGGLYVLDPVTLTLSDFNDEEPLPFLRGQIFCIKPDAENNLWIGTSQGLYQYKNGERINHFTSANSKLPEGNVYEIYFDSTKKGWICTENGMCIWDPSSQSLKTEVFPEGFIHKEKIRVVYEDSNHELYFLPDKGSMCVSDLSMNRFRHIQPNTLLHGKDGMFIIEDKGGYLWIGTNNGLLRYDKADLFIPYNFIDGIPSSIFTLCPPVQDENECLWMGNSKGLIYIDLNLDDDKRSYVYLPAITSLHVNGKETVRMEKIGDKSYNVVLEPNQRNLTIGLSNFLYTDPAYLSFEYKTDKVDTDWQIVSGKPEVHYYNLSPGNYVFRAKHIGDDDSEILLSIKIPYPVWTWIWSAVAVLLVLFAGGYYWWHRKKRPHTHPVQTEENVVTEDVEKTIEEKYKTNKINSEECQRLKEKLDALMLTDRPYTNPDLKIADLAAMIGTSAHALSYLFNQYLNRNYYDYINDYRIAEFKRLVEQEEYSKYTLSALAELCGFSSRASFFRYFKKATGITPNEHIRSVGKTNE